MSDCRSPYFILRYPGFTEKVLNALDSEDLSYVIRLQVALGNALSMAQQIADSVTAYQDSLRVSTIPCRAKPVVIPSMYGSVLTSNRCSVDCPGIKGRRANRRSVDIVSGILWPIDGSKTWTYHSRS